MGGYPIQIGILGPLTVRVGGDDVTRALPTQVRPLLVALALAPEPVAKHELAREVLYISPATVDSRLSRLRAALGLAQPVHRVVGARSGRIELDRSLVVVDSDEFRVLAAAHRLDAPAEATERLEHLLSADRLWRGRLEESSALGDPNARTPVGRARAELVAQRRAAIVAAAQLGLRHELAIGATRLASWTRSHPDLDTAWFARLVEAFDHRGRGAAQGVLDEWSEVRLSAGTADASSSLLEWGRRLVMSGSPRSPRRGRSTVGGRQPPVGRTSALETIDRLLDVVSDRGAPVVTIQGAAGAGKSCLLEYASARATERNIMVCRIDADEQIGLVEMVCAALGGLWQNLCRDPDPAPTLVRRAAAFARLFDGFDACAVDGGTWEPADPTRHLGELARDLLTAGTRRSPIVLVIDNAHRAEVELDRFVRGLTTPSIPGLALVVASRRPVVADPRSDRAARIDLGPLDAVDARRLIQEVRGCRLSADATERLMQRVGGMPLALLAASLDDAVQVFEVDDAVRTRLAARPASDKRALALAAVATYGTECDRDLVRALAPDDEIDAALALEAARGEILTGTADALSFTHRAWQEAAYDLLDPSERRRLHGLAVRHLDERMLTLAQPVAFAALARRIAEHAQRSDSGTLARSTAVQALVRAAQRLGPSDGAYAVELFDRAIEASGDGPGTRHLMHQRARARWLMADWEGARRDLTTVRQWAEQTGDLATAAESLLLSAHLTWEPVPAEQLAGQLERLLDRVPPDERLLRARISACLAGGLFQDGSTGSERDSAGLAIDALRMLKALPVPADPEIEAELLWWARKGLLDVEPPPVSARRSARMLAVSCRSEHLTGMALLASIVDGFVAGRPKRADALAHEYAALADRSGAPIHAYTAATLTGLRALYEGRFDDVVLATTAAEAAGGFGGVTATQVIEGQRVCLARERGAFRTQPELVELVEALTPVDGPIPLWAAAAAWLRADAADPSGALDRLAEIEEITACLTAIPRGPHRLPFFALLAETLADIVESDATRGNRMVERLLAEIVTALDEHHGRGVLLGWPVAYLGSKARYQGLVALASNRPTDAVHHLERALRAHGRATPLGVRNRLALARAQRRLGSPLAEASARASLRRARALGMAAVAADAASLLDGATDRSAAPASVSDSELDRRE